MNDFLRDPSGTQARVGAGEAQVVNPIKPFDWDRFFDLKRANDAEKKREEERNAALLTDKTKAEWVTDDMAYIEPKKQAIRDKFVKWSKESGGRLTPMQRAEIQNDWNQLNGYVGLNNKLRENYISKVKKLDEDKGKEYDWDNSVKVLQTWNNPSLVPEFKKDIQDNYKGDINAWRAANEHNFQLIPAYAEDPFYSELAKDEKAVAYQRRDAKGNIVYEKLPTGERAYYEGKRLTPDQVNTLTNRVLSGTGYKYKKTQELAAANVDKDFTITSDGIIAFNANLDPTDKGRAQRIIANAGDLKGLTEGEIKKRLVKGYIATQIEAKNGEGETLKQIGFAPVRSSTTPKETTTIATHYSNIAKEVQQEPNLSPDQVAERFGGTAITNPRTGTFDVNLPIPPTVKPFVVVPIGSTLTLKDHNYTRNRGAKGQVAGTVAGNQLTWKDKNGVTTTPNSPGAEPYGQVFYNPVKADPQNDNEFEQSFALFKEEKGNENVSKEAYKQMLQNGSSVGKAFKVEYNLNDAVQRTYYDAVLGTPAISQTAFNKESKASGKAPVAKPINETKKKESPAERAARIARGG